MVNILVEELYKPQTLEEIVQEAWPVQLGLQKDLILIGHMG